MMRATLLALVLVACSGGARVSPSSEDAGLSCSYPSTIASCATCAQKSCCAELAACDADPLCRPLGACLARCAPDDRACAAKCRHERPNAYGVLASRLATCVANRCDRDCGGSCGGYVASDASCGACSDAKCCAPSNACLSDPVCADLLACERACYALDGACLGLCERTHPAAVEAARAFAGCLEAQCATSCLPKNLRCLDGGRPIGPAITRSSVTLSVQTLRFIDGTPWVGVSVRACGAFDYNCAKPIAGPFVSDDAGFVAFDLPGPKFAGYFEVTGASAINSLYFVGEITEDSYRNLYLVDDAVFGILTAPIVDPDPARGHFIITAQDCRGANAAGVSYTIDPSDGAMGAYISMGFPTAAAKATDGTGFGGFINVRPNTGIKIHATLAGFDRPFPEVTAFTRPGWIAYVLDKPWAP